MCGGDVFNVAELYSSGSNGIFRAREMLTG